MNAKIAASVVVVGALVAVAAWWLAAGDIEEEQLSPSLRESESRETGPRRDPGLATDERRDDHAETRGESAAAIERRVLARGSVETPEGRGVSTVVEISVRGPDGRGDGSMLVPTDPEGRFERDLTPLLRTGVELTAIVFSLGDVALRGEAVTVESSGALEENGVSVFEARLIARTETLVTGRVVVAAGTPVAEAPVMIVLAKDGRPAGEDAIVTGRTEADGRFALAVRTREPCIVVAMPRGRRPGAADVTPVPGRATDVGDIVSPEGVSIAGRLTMAGRAIPNAVVTAVAVVGGWGLTHHGAGVDLHRWTRNGIERWKTTARTDDEGRFELRGLAPETYRVHAGDFEGPFKLDPEQQNSEWWFQGDDRLEVRPGLQVRMAGGALDGSVVEVGAPAKGVMLRLEGALVRVIVQAEETPVADADVEVGSGSMGNLTTNEKGVVHLLVPPGRRELSAWKDGFGRTEQTVNLLRSDEPVEVVLRLDAKGGGRLVVHALEPTGGPLTATKLRLDPVHWDFTTGRTRVRRELTGADGRHDLGPLPSGEYHLYVAPADDRPLTHEPLRVVVPDEGVEEVTVRMILGAKLRIGARRDDEFVRVSFTLRTVGGEALSVTVRTATPGGRRVAMGTSVELGCALNDVEPALAPGRYELLFGEGEERIKRVVDLSAGDARDVIIDL